MNGELTVNSTPGEGSIFEFTMTLGLPPEPQCSDTSCCPSHTQELVSEHDKLKGARVILVDSHPVRQVFSNIYAFAMFRRHEFFCEMIIDELVNCIGSH